MFGRARMPFVAPAYAESMANIFTQRAGSGVRSAVYLLDLVLGAACRCGGAKNRKPGSVQAQRDWKSPRRCHSCELQPLLGDLQLTTLMRYAVEVGITPQPDCGLNRGACGGDTLTYAAPVRFQPSVTLQL